MTVQMQRDGDRVSVVGDLTLHTVRGLYDRTGEITGGEVNVSLDRAGTVDSAGIALLLHWQQSAAAAGGRLVFQDVPERTRQMAEINGIGDLFSST